MGRIKPARVKRLRSATRAKGPKQRFARPKPGAKLSDLAILKIPVSEIIVRDRHRRDFGDLDALARNIADLGALLQPIVITPSKVLVAGERRLRAVRDILGWKEIDAKVVNIPSIVEGEYAENELRKDWTASERVNIAQAVAAEIGNRQGRRSDLRADSPQVKVGERTRDAVARLAGFSSTTTYRDAKLVAERGIPEVIGWMDKGTLAISVCADLARLQKEKQNEAVNAGPKTAKRWIDHHRDTIRDLEARDAGESRQNFIIPEIEASLRDSLGDSIVRTRDDQIAERLKRVCRELKNLNRDVGWLVEQAVPPNLQTYSLANSAIERLNAFLGLPVPKKERAA